MIGQLKGQYPVQRLCQVLALARSSYYAAPTPREIDPAVVAAVEQVLMRWPTYGYRRMQVQLRREGIDASERQVRPILRQLGVTWQVGRVPISDCSHPRYPNRRRDLTVTMLDEVWVADITYLRFG